jgi:hypothetical protein
VRPRLFPIIAVAASGIEALLALHVVRFGVRGLNLSLLLGAALAVAGALIWNRTGGKTHVTAATVLMLVGAVQVLTTLG